MVLVSTTGFIKLLEYSTVHYRTTTHVFVVELFTGEYSNPYGSDYHLITCTYNILSYQLLH